MSQPRLKVSVNVSLDDILCIAEPFVTKPSMVRHHYKPERHMRKMGLYLQGHGNWISVIQSDMTISVICSELLIFGGNQLSLTVLECLVKRLFCCIERSRSQWRFWTSVNVYPDNISDQSNLVWWYTIISQSTIQKYHFAMFKVKATIISARSSAILKLLQSKLVWWYFKVYMTNSSYKYIKLY